MSPDESPVPTDDAIARAARHALGALSEEAPGNHSWAAVQTGARRRRQRRASVAGAACALVFVGAGAAVAMTNHDDGGHLRVAGPGSTTTPTTSTPLSYDSSSAATTTSSPGGAIGPTTTVGALPSDAPQAADVTGTITVHWPELHAVRLGTSVEIDTTIRNGSDHLIWTANSQVPTSYATVCSTESSDPIHTMWWMTNVSLASGATTGRIVTFTPTAAYVGKVECELDVVWSNQQGNTFDTTAGGDPAQTYVIARVPGVPLTTFAVYAPPNAAP